MKKQDCKINWIAGLMAEIIVLPKTNVDVEPITLTVYSSVC